MFSTAVGTAIRSIQTRLLRGAVVFSLIMRPIYLSFHKLTVWLAFVVLAIGCQHEPRSGSLPPGPTTSKSPGPSAEMPARPADSAEERRIRALTHYAVGIIDELNDHTEEAIAAYYQSALADPGNESLVIELSRRLIQAKQLPKALELLSRSAALPDASGSIHAWYGLALAQTNQIKSAVAHNLRAIKKAPQLALPYKTLIQIHQEAGDQSAAAKVLKSALDQPKAEPEFILDVVESASEIPEFWVNEAKSLKPIVIATLDRAQESKPVSPLLQQQIADSYRAIGAYDKAVAIYQQMLEKYANTPGFREVLREKLLETHIRSGNRQAARELLENLMRENPTNAQIYLALASLAVEAKDYPAAIGHFEKALILNPALEPAYYDLAGLHITTNQPKEALVILDKARARFGQTFNLELYTAFAHSRLKQYPEALKCFTAAEVVAGATDPKRLNHAFYFQLGAAHERNGDLEQAEKYFRKCLALKPDDAEALNYLGYMWAEKGIRLNEARSFIEKALKTEPRNAAFLDSMGWVLFKLGRTRDAMSYLEKAVQWSTEPDATLYDHLGDIRAALKQWPKACVAWRKSLEIEPNDSVRAKLEKHDQPRTGDAR